MDSVRVVTYGKSTAHAVISVRHPVTRVSTMVTYVMTGPMLLLPAAAPRTRRARINILGPVEDPQIEPTDTWHFLCTRGVRSVAGCHQCVARPRGRLSLVLAAAMAMLMRCVCLGLVLLARDTALMCPKPARTL